MYVGKFTNTHGIKGEIKIQSDLDHKEEIFKKGNILTIASKSFEIVSYRVHKGYDMVTFKDINNINDIIMYKGKSVFIDRSTLSENVTFLSDLIDVPVYLNDECIGLVTDYENGANPLLICNINNKKVLIPLLGDFIIEKNKDKVIVNEKVKELFI